MTAYRRAALPLLGLVALVAFPTASPVSAQDGGANPPLFVAIPDHFPDLDARAVIMREPGRDIVVLDAADPDQAASLRTALAVLLRVRREHPDLGGQGQLIPITGYALRRPIRPDERAQLEATVARLKRRSVAQIGNLGAGRWMPYTEP